jgi:hypothetical protein
MSCSFGRWTGFFDDSGGKKMLGGLGAGGGEQPDPICTQSEASGERLSGHQVRSPNKKPHQIRARQTPPEVCTGTGLVNAWSGSVST